MIQRGNGLQVVVGLGKSGLSAVNYLHALGYPVAVTDAGLPKLAEHLPTDIVTKFGALDGELLQWQIALSSVLVLTLICRCLMAHVRKNRDCQ